MERRISEAQISALHPAGDVDRGVTQVGARASAERRDLSQVPWSSWVRDVARALHANKHKHKHKQKAKAQRHAHADTRVQGVPGRC